MLTTGQIARRASLSEKAVRLYADRGLLVSERDPNSHRWFSEGQVERARLIALLRSLGLSLAEVGTILDAEDVAVAFDELWDLRRSVAAQTEDAGRYVRGVLSGAPALPRDLRVQHRVLSERLVLRIRAEAGLMQIPTVLPELSGRLFEALKAADAALAGPLYVEFCSRATETFPAQLYVCAPLAGDVVRPLAGMEVAVDIAHTELFVRLRQEEADDQGLVVAIHDFLSSEYGSLRSGNNRDVYYPTYATGANGEVMDVAVVIPRDVTGDIPTNDS